MHAIHRPLEPSVSIPENVTFDVLFKQPTEEALGNSPAWRRVMETVGTVAASNATVLICGESGTGKELIAEAIHQRSPRARGPLVKIHCAALPENLLEAELFGHEKGAFTGAMNMRKGRFEDAHGGTLFLDEVGEIPLAMQVKLLRVLQARAFERLGSNITRRTDFRLVAATHQDLQAEVKAKRFREDLFYRLNVIPIQLPPLRDRKEDIPLLARHFLTKFTAANNKTFRGFTPEALDRLSEYAFPGNVRELENLVERAVVLCQGEYIQAEDLLDCMACPRSKQTTHSEDPLERLWRGEWNLEQLEHFLIQEAMRRAGGTQIKAASLLGISRRTLQYRLKSIPCPALNQA